MASIGPCSFSQVTACLAPSSRTVWSVRAWEAVSSGMAWSVRVCATIRLSKHLVGTPLDGSHLPNHARNRGDLALRLGKLSLGHGKLDLRLCLLTEDEFNDPLDVHDSANLTRRGRVFGRRPAPSTTPPCRPPPAQTGGPIIRAVCS
jgi:hypothetical protein